MNEEAYELGDKSLKTADMGNVMEGQAERNNVDYAIKTTETGKDGKSQGERLNVDDVIKTIAKEEGLEVQQSFMNDVFATERGLESKAFLLDSLLPRKQIYVNVIDCWAAVLNHQQKFISEGSPKQLFCHASMFVEWMFKRGAAKSKRMGAFRKHMVQVVECYEEKADMRSYDMVMFPILEMKHLYLVCFDMKNPSIYVTDNMKKSVFGVRDSTIFFDKSTPYKVKHIFCEYLESVNHPKAHVMEKMHPRKLKLKWEMTDNVTDCRVFVMRHMEMFKGKEYEFECGFNDNERRNTSQINNLRMKYVAKILLSDANVYKEKVMRDAEETSKKMESNEYGNVIKGLGGYEDIEKALGVTEEAMKDDHKDAYHRVLG
ncbi:hypothetical protein L1987_80789 [Smallanthus sonchifolius]|uniref:Uncharacterized protein n=1 Tax=Smallanthus sonchifolius TaxID=185202 RepID=A0ACB8YP79_9ASTR|nr:hypothetical protein L1987_80789 [Smallanthus sonchifolius]